MDSGINAEQSWLRATAVAGSSLAAGLGAVALVGWISGWTVLATFGVDRIPMAPSTALLFLLFGVLSLVNRPQLNEPGRLRRSALALGVLGTGAAAVLLVTASFGIAVEAEHLGLPIAGTVAGAPIGYMSPVTAAGFVLAGVAYLLTSAKLAASPRPAKVAFLLALALSLIGIVLTSAYGIGGPLLYDSGVIPPALTTSLGFLALGMALSAAAGRRIQAGEEFAGTPSPRQPYGLFALVGLLGLSVIAAAYGYYQNYERAFRREVESELSAVAELKVRELTQWRTERLGDGRVFYHNRSFSSLVDRYLSNPNDPDVSRLLSDWLENTRSAYGYRQVLLVDAQGAKLLSSPPSDGPAAPHLVETAQDVLSRQEVALVDFHRHAPDDPIILTVMVPILDPAAQETGIAALAMEVDPGRYLYPTIQKWPSTRATAETLLVRPDGDDVLFLNDLRFAQDAALRLRRPVTDQSLPAAMAIHGTEGLVEGNDYRGVPVVAAVRAIPDSPWSLVAKIDTAEIYAPMRQRLWFVLGVVGILLAAMVSVVGIDWQRRAKAHYRELYEAETRYGTTLRSIGDGVIATDELGRITLLNPVAEALTGWAAQEARGRPLTEVFPIINENSRAEVESPVSRVLREGVVIGLANHTVLQARDGREIPIADSGAPIHAPDGSITGVVLIFRDQTQEREAQRRVQMERARAQRYFDVAGVMLVVLSRQGDVVRINDKGCEILDYPEREIVGKNWFDHFLPSDRRDWVREAFGRLASGETGRDASMENSILTRSGTERIVAWRNAVIRDENGAITGVLSSGADVTERRQAEADLRRIEWMLDPSQTAPDRGPDSHEAKLPEYGDLVELNDDGTILAAVGRETLESIARDFLDLLDTSSAIYEADGSYALGIFSSGWCRLMDQASRRLCGTADNREALASGKWLCHESCWRDASLASMQVDGPVDVACLGGIRLYAIPIHAGDEIIGVINFGYGDPPQDLETLQALAETYHLDLDQLRASAEAYESRPPFIVELAKRRIHAAAHLIGEIVSRRRATEALQASERALNRAQRVAHVGSWTWNVQTNRLEWSDEMYRIFGIDRATFTGHLPDVIANAIHPDDRAAVEASNTSVIRDARPLPLEYRIIWPDGTIRTVWAEAGDLVLDEAGNPAVLSGIVQDITQRKAVEAERQALLALSQEQAQEITQIIETVPQGVVLLDADGQVQLTNPTAASQLSLLADATIYDLDALSTTLSDPVAAAAEVQAVEQHPAPPKITRLGDRPLSDLLTSPPRGVWHEIHADGRAFEAIARPIADRSEPERWVLVIQDVTQEHQIRDQLRQQERLAAVGQLAAGIAHDFNNIMGVIVLHAQMALTSAALPTRDRERLETINQQAHHAAQLIEQILDFSRRSVVDRRPLDLLPLVKEHVRLLQRTLPENIEVTLGLRHEPEQLMYRTEADPTRIQQVLMNLAVNARDAMPEGGKLRIGLETVHIDPNGTPPVAQMAPGDWVALWVADTGTGISEDALPHIFEPFYTTKAPGQGSGLGLAQIHGIVAQHGGQIDVQTEVGRGSTFTVYLPASTSSAGVAEQAAAEAAPQGQGEVILVVEDNAVLRDALCETLISYGYQVQEAADGHAALALLAQDDGCVELVLSDVVMPQVGGLALARALQERGSELPIILMSGHPKQSDLTDLRAEGVSDWLTKPPDLDELARAIAAALRPAA